MLTGVMKAIIAAITVVIVIICYSHYRCFAKISEICDTDLEIIRRAANSSILASNTVDPIIALTNVAEAVNTIEIIHEKHGSNNVYPVLGINTKNLLKILRKQKNRIIKDIMNEYPTIVREHPLNSFVIKLDELQESAGGSKSLRSDVSDEVSVAEMSELGLESGLSRRLYNDFDSYNGDETESVGSEENAASTNNNPFPPYRTS